ncbi:hypothetical protein JTE90_020472 [Oedothorax gibbosus]|uniref:RecA family profile 1 domain-containing protein n=1 Tax=Oedothorax gibbosus TaxID=931172 RepID=A0AAV6U926_9ARAC|nr:hypothetical protein JTE90_020472 [Oedothorax gibbosus]
MVMPRLFEGICPQFTQPVFNQCKQVGIKTVADFITQDPEILAKKMKTPFKDVLIIHRSLTVQFSGFTQSASSLFNDLLETISILDTGSKSLNRFLKGGVYTGEITEIHGPPGSGKTQFCLSVISNLILESNSTVLYLDTSGNFTGKRLLLMLQKSNDKQDFTKKLQNVKIMRIYDIYDLFDSIESLVSELNKQESRFSRHLKLLVLDSVTPLLAPCFGSKFLDAVSLINNLAQQLNGLCSDHKLSVLVCNNTVQAKGSLIKPALGMPWKYVPTVSLSIEKSNNPVHKIKTVKSCRSGLSGSVSFKISEAGITD